MNLFFNYTSISEIKYYNFKLLTTFYTFFPLNTFIVTPPLPQDASSISTETS